MAGRGRSASRESHAGDGGAYARLGRVAPEVAEAYERLADCSAASGPLDAAGVATIKVALSVGRGSWRGVHAHARKALEAGVSADVLRHIAIVAVPTAGLHGALDALRWIEEAIDERANTPVAKRAPTPRKPAAGGRR